MKYRLFDVISNKYENEENDSTVLTLTRDGSILRFFLDDLQDLIDESDLYRVEFVVGCSYLGDDIFENDIVMCNGNKFKVIREKHVVWFVHANGKRYHYVDFIDQNIKVVGNMNLNPELLGD